MKFPISIDLRHETLAKNIEGVEVMDAGQERIMTVYPDETSGMYDRAGAIVDALNLAWSMQKALKL